MNVRHRGTIWQPLYDPAAMSAAEVVALSPYLVERADEAVVLLGSRAGTACGMTVHDFEGLSGSGDAGLAETWSPLHPDRLTALLFSLDSGRALWSWEAAITTEFLGALHLGWSDARSIWIYGDRRWLEGSLVWDDLHRIQNPPVADPVTARVSALGLHAGLERLQAPHGALPDFGRIPDGSHLDTRNLFELTDNFSDDDSDRESMAEQLRADPHLLAGAIDHLLGDDADRTLTWAEGLGGDGENYRADATGLALQALAHWRWVLDYRIGHLPRSESEPFAAQVRALLETGVTAAALGWQP